MTKTEFVLALTAQLEGLPFEEVEERIDFYMESVDDRMEEGLAEEEAVAALGSVDDIVAEILADIPLTRLVAEKIKPRRRLSAWEIVLIAVGSPIWISLLAAFFAVDLSIYVSIWSVCISLWAAEVSFIASALGGVVGGISLLVTGNTAGGLFLIGCGLALAGLSIPFSMGCRILTKGLLLLTKKIAVAIKKLFIRKEKAE